jgi:hypothetical protein
METLTKAARSAVSMRDLAAQLEEMLGPAWARSVAWLRNANKLADVEARIAVGDYTGALQGITDAARLFATEVGAAQNIAARHAADWLGNEADRLVAFDQTNVNAVAAVARTRTDLIRAITEDQRASVTGAIRDGIEAGSNPKEIARDVRMSVGLTDGQRQIVQNLRNELEAGRFNAAADRELIDGNSSRTLERLARDGGALTNTQIDAMTDRYAANMSAWRSQTIARTEGLRAAHIGHQTMFQQAVDDGVIAGADLVQRWNHKKIGRHWRRGHARMHGQERAFGDAFVNPDSGEQLMHPLDPDAPAEETINCRCVVSTRYIPRR